MNALDAAQTLLHSAINALERHSQPTPKDVETALGHAKNATVILKAANELLDEGIFTITAEPEAGVPLPFGGDSGVDVLTIPRRMKGER